MSNHFATAPFVLIYSIRRLSNTFIYFCYLKTSLRSKEMNLLRRFQHQLPLQGEL